MKVHMLRKAAHRCRSQREIYERIGRGEIKAKPHHMFESEARHLARNYRLGRGPQVQEMIGDRLRRAPAELEREAYAAACRRRYLSRRITDKHDAICRPRRDESARGYAPRAALDDAGARIRK